MTTPANPDDLTAWLRAQLDTDEQDARAANREATNGYILMLVDRTLAEVDAKRRILDLAASITDQHDDEQVWYQRAIGDVLRRMALPSADRPGYREEWRPQ